MGTIKDTSHVWKGTHLKGGSGLFTFDDQVISGLIGSWLQQDLGEIPDARKRVSSKQRDVIQQSVEHYLRKNAKTQK